MQVMSEPMKIMHAAETIKGGIATVIKHLANESVRLESGIQVKCFVPATQVGDLQGVSTSEVITFPAGARGLLNSLYFMFYFMRAVLIYKPDVVHLHSSFAGAFGRTALLFLRPLHRCRVVYSPHAFSFTMDVPGWKKNLYAFIERVLLRVTDTVICTCRYELDVAIQFGLEKSKLTLIYNGVPDPGALPQLDKGVAADALQLLFVGRFDRQKGFDILLEAMQLLESESVHLTAIGASIHGGISVQFRPNIHYVGWVELAALPEYYRKSHLLVVPSRWEGFAMVPLEALSNGLPILSSDHPSFNEPVIPGVTGESFPCPSAVMLAEKIRSLSVEDLMSRRESCYRHYRQNFQVITMVHKTLSLYRQFLGGA